MGKYRMKVGDVMTRKKLSEMTEEERKTLQEEYLKTMEAKLKKSEKEIWFVHEKEKSHLYE